MDNEQLFSQLSEQIEDDEGEIEIDIMGTSQSRTSYSTSTITTTTQDEEEISVDISGQNRQITGEFAFGYLAQQPEDEVMELGVQIPAKPPEEKEILIAVAPDISYDVETEVHISAHEETSNDAFMISIPTIPVTIPETEDKEIFISLGGDEQPTGTTEISLNLGDAEDDYMISLEPEKAQDYDISGLLKEKEERELIAREVLERRRSMKMSKQLSEQREIERNRQEWDEQERLEQERVELERLEEERQIQIRIEKERAEEEERQIQIRIEKERAEEERLIQIRIEKERAEEEERQIQIRIEQERAEEEERQIQIQIRIEKERAEEEERQIQIRIEQERIEQERVIQVRIEEERIEQERQIQIRIEQERIEQERIEQERLLQIKLEEERIEKIRLEEERIENERLEQERIKQSLEKQKNDFRLWLSWKVPQHEIVDFHSFWENGVALIDVCSVILTEKEVPKSARTYTAVAKHFSLSVVDFNESSVLTNLHLLREAEKKTLLEWASYCLPDIQVVNFNVDWNDGKLIRLLIEKVAPEYMFRIKASNDLGSIIRLLDIPYFSQDITIDQSILVQTVCFLYQREQARSLHYANSLHFENRTISNLTTDWLDGKLFISLIENALPGVFEKDKFAKCESLVEVLKVLNIPRLPLQNIRIITLLVAIDYIRQLEKKHLLIWLRGRIPELKISNFSTDWEDGSFLMALDREIVASVQSDEPSAGIREVMLALNFPKVFLEQYEEFTEETILSCVRHYRQMERDKLLEWVNLIVPENGVKNFSTDWKNGRALAQICLKIYPALDISRDSQDFRESMKKLNLPFDIKEITEHTHLLTVQYLMQTEKNSLLLWANSKLQGDITDVIASWEDGQLLYKIIYDVQPSSASVPITSIGSINDVFAMLKITRAAFLDNDIISCLRFYKSYEETQLRKWIAYKAPSLRYANFGADWKNAKLLSLLVEACSPVSITVSGIPNAIKIAQTNLNVPAVDPKIFTETAHPLLVISYLLTLKKRAQDIEYELITWLLAKVPSLRIEDFASPWSQENFVALIDAFCPYYVDPGLMNYKYAVKLAEQLRVPIPLSVEKWNQNASAVFKYIYLLKVRDEEYSQTVISWVIQNIGIVSFGWEEQFCGDNLCALLFALLPAQKTEENLAIVENGSEVAKIRFAVRIFSEHNVPGFFDADVSPLPSIVQQKYFGTIYFKHRNGALISSDEKPKEDSFTFSSAPTSESPIVGDDGPGSPEVSFFFSALITFFGWILVFSNLTVCLALAWFCYSEIATLLDPVLPYWLVPGVLYPVCYLIVANAHGVTVIFWKWILLLGSSEGRFGIYTFYYWRWWLFRYGFMNVNSVFTDLWQGTLVLNWYYRILGATIGSNVQIYGSLDLYDRIHIEDDCYIGNGTKIEPFEFLEGTFTVRNIKISSNSSIGDYSILVGGAEVPPSQNINPYSRVDFKTKYVPTQDLHSYKQVVVDQDIELSSPLITGNNQTARNGSEFVDLSPEDDPTSYVTMTDVASGDFQRQQMGFFQGLFQFFSTLFFFVIIRFPEAMVISLLVFLYSLLETLPVVKSYYMIYILFFFFVIVLAVARNFVVSVLTLRVSLLFTCCVSRGIVDVSSWYALWMKWFPSKLVGLSASFVNPFSDTVLHNLFLKAMGMHVSLDARVKSNVTNFSPPYSLITVEPEAYIGSDVAIASHVVSGMWRVQNTVIGKNNIIRPLSAVYTGVQFEEDCIVDFHTVVPPTANMERSQLYSGNPAQRSQAEWTEHENSVSPFHFLPYILFQLLLPQIFLFSAIFPAVGTVYILASFFPSVLLDQNIVPHIPLVFVLFPFAYLFFMVLLTSYFILLKWLLVRYDSEGKSYLRSGSSLLYAIYEVIEETWHHYCGGYFHGTFWMVLVHRFLGLGIGWNSLMFTRVKYPDMVKIGDHCVLESDCNFAAGNVVDGTFVLNNISVGDNCMIGKRCAIRGGAIVADRIILTHLGLVVSS